MGSSKAETVPTGTSSSTSQSGLAPWAQTKVQGGLNLAQNAYNAGPNAGTQAAIDKLMGPNLSLDAAGANLQGTLQGDYLNPSTNPYLQQTFDLAAQGTQNQLSSEFAGAGRNFGASLYPRSMQLQGLASGIFGGNYQAERDRQMQALNLTPLLAGLPAQFQAQAGALQSQPLNDYLGQLAQLGQLGNYSSSSSQGTQQQAMYGGGASGALKGGLGGAATGASIGAMMGPGAIFGVPGGALAGGIIGALGGW